MSEGELILYKTEDGITQISLREMDGTVWLTQAEIAELFQTTPQNITMLIKGIYEDQELSPEATCKDLLQVRTEGQREVQRALKNYNLDMILAIGYRIRSVRGIQFRQWATTTLREYLVKGFVLNDERLKNPGGWDYFDELLERIREIRASEKRFYQKIKDIYSTSTDYNPRSDEAQVFFKTVQNKMLYAVAGHTAAELIVQRASSEKPNMGLTTWEGSRVRKRDVVTAKNYLIEKEISELNRITTMYLDFAEDQAARRKTMTMKEWEQKLDDFLAFNEREVLKGAGRISHDRAEAIAHEHYAAFDTNRREADRIAADEEHMEELQHIEKDVRSLRKDIPSNKKKGGKNNA